MINNWIRIEEKKSRYSGSNRIKLVSAAIRTMYLYIGVYDRKTTIKQLKNEIGTLEYEAYNIAAPATSYNVGSMINTIVSERMGIDPSIAKRKIELLNTMIEELENENYCLPLSLIRKIIKPIFIDTDAYYGYLELTKDMCMIVTWIYIELKAINGVSKAQALSAFKDRISVDLLELDKYSRRQTQAIASEISKQLFGDYKGSKENRKRYKNFKGKYWGSIAHS